MTKAILLFASINGALAVMLGAFGAHGLKDKVSENLLSAWQTGIQYHFIHVLALLGLGIMMMRLTTISPLLNVSAYLWMAGIILFSGSLYGLTLGGPNWLGPITPLGGLLLIIGWLTFTAGIVKTNFWGLHLKIQKASNGLSNAAKLILLPMMKLIYISKYTSLWPTPST